MFTLLSVCVLWYQVLTTTPTQAELTSLARRIGSSYQDIAIQFLNYRDEEIETLKEELLGNIDRVKFKLLNGWVQRNPEGNPRHVRNTIRLMCQNSYALIRISQAVMGMEHTEHGSSLILTWGETSFAYVNKHTWLISINTWLITKWTIDR